MLKVYSAESLHNWLDFFFFFQVLWASLGVFCCSLPIVNATGAGVWNAYRISLVCILSLAGALFLGFFPLSGLWAFPISSQQAADLWSVINKDVNCFFSPLRHAMPHITLSLPANLVRQLGILEKELFRTLKNGKRKLYLCMIT